MMQDGFLITKTIAAGQIYLTANHHWVFRARIESAKVFPTAEAANAHVEQHNLLGVKVVPQ